MPPPDRPDPWRSATWLVLMATSALPICAQDRPMRLQVSPEFVIEQVAAEPDVRFPMFAAWDERGRLFVAESSGLDLYAELSALTRKCQRSEERRVGRAGRQ